jgi:hypothetical protein
MKFGDARRIFGEGIYRVYSDSTDAVEMSRFPSMKLHLNKGLWAIVTSDDWNDIYMNKYPSGEIPLSYLPDDLTVVALTIF